MNHDPYECLFVFCLPGLFEVRAAEYLDTNSEPEPSGVNKFLKGLGECCFTSVVCFEEVQFQQLTLFLFFFFWNRKQDEAPPNEVKKEQHPDF